MAIFLGVLLLLVVAALVIVKGVWTKGNENKAKQAFREAQRSGRMREDAPDQDTFVAEYKESHAWPVPGFVSIAVLVLAVGAFGVGTFNKVFFYAEPGFVYHVRTITGEERVINQVGYAYKLFGNVNVWKKAMTVQAGAVGGGAAKGADALAGETESVQTSASLPALTVVMLDQVDSALSATTRFRIPVDSESFLKMAHEYRTPDNLLRTALVPAFKETLQATGSLMAAEEYYSGRRTEFNAEFENQMSNGIYLVSRHQVEVRDETAVVTATADGSEKGGAPVTTGGTKIKFEVTKQLDSDGLPIRKKQGFTNFGITVVEARVTDLKPNEKFVERMQLKQQAAADRAIATEQRVQEVEQKLLAVAKGEREVAEEQAAAKRVQIKQTTEAETTKRLALIAANKQLEQARVDKETAAVVLERDKIKAESIQVLADADKYEREARIAGDNALQAKLDAEIAIQKVWAEAYARRQVPQYVFGGGADGDTPVGSDTETTRFLQLMTTEAAKRLAYDRGIPADVGEQK